MSNEATALPSISNAESLEVLELPNEFPVMSQKEKAKAVAACCPTTTTKKAFLAMRKAAGVGTAAAEREFYCALKGHHEALAVYLTAAQQVLGADKVTKVRILKGGAITAKFDREPKASSSVKRVNAELEAAQAREAEAIAREASLRAEFEALKRQLLPAPATAQDQAATA